MPIKLIISIPSARDINSIIKIFEGLSISKHDVICVIARWINSPLSEIDINKLNEYITTIQVYSRIKYPPSMRNAIINSIDDGYVLFLDDDIIPSSNLIEECLKMKSANPNSIIQGAPYLVYNSESWLARMEGHLYERGFKRYLQSDGTVAILDARVLLAPISI